MISRRPALPPLPMPHPRALAEAVATRARILADELSNTLSNAAASETARAHAAAGLERLKNMFDAAKGAIAEPITPIFDPRRRVPVNAKAFNKFMPIFDKGILEAEQHLKAASPARFADYATTVMGKMGGMGIWSLNPNLWGLSQEEALAYEAAAKEAALKEAQTQAEIDAIAAQTAIQEAQTEATANQLNPGFTSTFTESLNMAMKGTATTYNLLLFGAVVGLGIWAYSEMKSARGKR